MGRLFGAVEWEAPRRGLGQRIVGDPDLNPDLPLPSYVFPPSAGLSADVFPSVKWERRPRPSRERFVDTKEPERPLGLRVGQAWLHARVGGRRREGAAVGWG